MNKLSNKPCSQCGGEGNRMNPEWLREQRRQSGHSLRHMADVLGLSPSYLCDIELGRREIGAKHRVAVTYSKLEPAKPTKEKSR